MINILPTMAFSEAADLWMEGHRPSVKKRSIEAYLYYIATLKKVYGPMVLAQITPLHVLDYQHTRKLQVSAGLVNHELNTLQQILSAAGLWDGIRRHYLPLKPPQWTPSKVLTPEDEERFFIVANSKPEWRVACCVCIVAGNTSAIGQELRSLQLQHIFLDHNPPKFHINDTRVKNEFRARVIPLNPPAFAAMQEIVARARSLGAYAPSHFIFPKRLKRNQWDVTQPGSPAFIRKSFSDMREAAGLPWLQPRNFRNICITKLFESGAPDETIISIAGHQSIRMSRFYSRIRIESKASALDALNISTETTKPRKTLREGAFEIAEKVNTIMGDSVGAIGKLVERLKSVGLSPEKILEVVSGL